MKNKWPLSFIGQLLLIVGFSFAAWWLISQFGSPSHVAREDQQPQKFHHEKPKKWQLTSEQQKKNDDFAQNDFYISKVQPIFNGKCIQCHSCYNSPCQLNLTSFAGFSRGANKDHVYDFPLLDAKPPTRLNIDGNTFSDWKKLGFYKINSADGTDIFSQVIRSESTPKKGVAYYGEKGRFCAANAEELSSFKSSATGYHMPFGFPGLTDEEVGVLKEWKAKGYVGPVEQNPTQDENQDKILTKWEELLNRKELKAKISSRYIYEHLFLAHIGIEGLDGKFFRLARIIDHDGKFKEVATRRPYDQPPSHFKYKFLEYTDALVAKTHMPYHLNTQKFDRWRKHFFDGDWVAPNTMPAYGPEGANAFKTFSSIPTEVRYRFLLDDAEYHISTFIKGPVCRGQTALNVINDHFWVTFVDPKSDVAVTQENAFNETVAPKMFPPAEADDKIAFFNTFKDNYWSALHEKYALMKKHHPQWSTDDIWTGDEFNSNAALTVYRHFDSAQVLRGFWGEKPETVWLMDYQIFEDIYYNLVAGYDVFGAILHQLNTRLYMEISRVASEDMSLHLIDESARNKKRMSWNRESNSQKKTFEQVFIQLIGKDAKTKMNKDYPYLGNALKARDNLSYDQLENKLLNEVYAHQQWKLEKDIFESKDDVQGALSRIHGKRKLHLTYWPDHTVLKVTPSNEIYHVVFNKGHTNVSLIFLEDERRDTQLDSLNFLKVNAGSYPNLYLQVPATELAEFVTRIETVKSDAEGKKLLEKYGVSRDRDDFWDIHHSFEKHYYETEPWMWGAYDLNRYTPQTF